MRKPIFAIRYSVIILIGLCALAVGARALTSASANPRTIGNEAYLPVAFHPAPPVFGVTPMPGSFDYATSINNAGDARLFVTQVHGQIKILHPDGTVTMFMDLSDRVIIENPEMGLFYIVFDPNYASNGFFYVTYTGTNWYAGDRWVFLSRFQVSADPNAGDRNTESRILATRVDDHYSFHYGGGMGFNPMDGRLYVGIGDGAEESLAMDPSSTFGKIMRLDVSDLPLELPPLQPITADLLAIQSVDVYAMGLRNPWRFGIDPSNGNMFVADVGQNTREEVNFIANGDTGHNFGWPCLEGNDHPNPDPYVPAICENPFIFDNPIYQYPHVPACAIIGGPVYFPAPGSGGHFLFADFCTRQISWLWNSNGAWQVDYLGTLPDTTPGITTFGMGHDGKIYIATFGAPAPIYHLILPEG